MTGYKICQKYKTLSEIIQLTKAPGMAFISFDDILYEIMDQWPDIGYQSTVSKNKVVSTVVQFILEVIGHYRGYFRDEPIIFYHTDVESQSELFQTGMENGNEYRLNYLTRFTSIKYRDFRAVYLSGLLDVIKMVIDSVVGVHLVTVKNIDACLVPLIFAKEYPDREIYVITWDNAESILGYYGSNIQVVYDARGSKLGINPTVLNGRLYLTAITNSVNPRHYGKFANMITAAAVGNEKRSLYGVGKRKSGYDAVGQWLQYEFGNNEIPISYMDYHVISKQVPKNLQQDFEESFRGIDWEYQYQALRQEDKTSILYGLDHTPVDPNEIIKLFPNIPYEWNRLYG